MFAPEPYTSWSAPVIAFNALTLSAGLLVVRLVLGLLMAAHGAQKLFGWFGGYGLAGTGGFFEQLGFRPGRLFAALAAGTTFALALTGLGRSSLDAALGISTLWTSTIALATLAPGILGGVANLALRRPAAAPQVAAAGAARAPSR